MSKLSPQAIVEKADLAIANLTGEGNGGYLNPIQANFFIRKVGRSAYYYKSDACSTYECTYNGNK